MACHGGASLARVQFGRAERELPRAMEAGDFDEPYLSAYRSLIGGCNALPGVTTAADLREILGGVSVILPAVVERVMRLTGGLPTTLAWRPWAP